MIDSVFVCTCTYMYYCDIVCLQFLQRCSVDLFVDFFWVPALKMGQIQEVEGHLKTLDSSLEAWHSYLTAACRYFTQKGLYSVLYHTQLFMNVSVVHVVCANLA